MNTEFGKRALVVLLAAFAFTAQAQVNRYVVFFKDKAGSSYEVTRPEEFLSERAIERRISQDIDITEQDLPVNASYVSGVRGAGVNVFFTSRWFNAVLIQCDASKIPAVSALEFVERVEFVAPEPRLNPGGRKKFNLRTKNSHIGVQTVNQLTLIGINHMIEAGMRGEGKIIGVFDGGFLGVNNHAPFAHLFSEQRIDLDASYDFVSNDDNVFQYDDHGTNVLSVIAAEIPDMFTGGASKASFQLYVTEDVSSEYRIEEYNWAFAAERADSAGVDIVNSSLGYYDFDDASMNYSKSQMDGATTVVTKAAQWLADRGVIVVCSAGNEGTLPWKIITAPADAVDVLAVGSVDANGTRASSSSIGPTADNRIKPDVAAMGVGVRVVNQNGIMTSSSGTSLASPLVASLVAGVWQRYEHLTNKEVMNAIRITASQGRNPNNSLGYGIPNFRAVVNYLEPIVQDDWFAVYPNPLKDSLMVRPNNPDTITTCNIELIASNGQIIATTTAHFSWFKRTYAGDISTLVPGLYFVRIWYDNRPFVFKVVKE